NITFDAGDGSNFISISNGSDTSSSVQLTGGSGSDVFGINSRGSVTINAGDGDNSISASPNNFNSNFHIVSASGAETITIGPNSHFLANATTYTYFISSGDGNDTIQLANLWGTTDSSTNLVVTVEAGSGNDTIYAPQANNPAAGMGLAGSLTINA